MTFSTHPNLTMARTGPFAGYFSRARNSKSNLQRGQIRIRKQEKRASKLDDVALLDRAKQLLEKQDRRPNDRYEFAGLVADSVRRIHGFQLHDVQLQGVAAAMQGAIIEMQTGEGKTIVTGAAAAIKALDQNGVHVATTNAYLAKRDRENVSAVLNCVGLTTGLLPEEHDLKLAQQAYTRDVTYGPGYQFGFDYLRDQMTLREHRQSRLGCKTLNRISGFDPARLQMQSSKHHVALIDEADSVMIDEAMTPLVISGGQRETLDATPFRLAQEIASTLAEPGDYTIEMPDKKIELTDLGKRKCHQLVAEYKKLKLERPWKTYIVNAIRATKILVNGQDYVVQDDEVAIVDQNTGRIFSDRTWQDGLHQAVEFKEAVEVKTSGGSVARVTRQRYLRLYGSLSGFTGTATSVRSELGAVYSVPVVVIPTNLKSQRNFLPSRFFADFKSKYKAIVTSTIERVKAGQPVLIGARTIQESIDLKEAFVAAQGSISPVVLNGIQDEEEADIIAAAGTSGSVTIATNMAGRGTDIKPDSKAIAAGGLHVIGTSPNLSSRIDRQLVGRAARQGDPGSAQFFVGAEDELIQSFDQKLGQRIARQSNQNGECEKAFQPDIARLQRLAEAKSCQQREQMILQDRWFDMVRESFEKE